jgi:putative spermidine/putrescine transport system ATP-binding protein
VTSRTATPSVVELHKLGKRYGPVVAVADVSLSIDRGEVVCLLGPSGCGKTTTLKMVAGFVTPSAGRIVIQGTDVSATPAHKRDTGMVFQNYALFPHLSVEENIAFAPRNVGMKTPAIRQRVGELLELIQMTALAARLPRELSGGQQQRVALARALAIRPAVLLLDEPFSNLDAKLRAQMREELRVLITQLETTTLFVTHDQEEAMAIADRIVIMNGGRIEQAGRPSEVYERPRTRFVAQFMGRCNFIPVEAIEHDRVAVLRGGKRIETANADPGARVLAVRPHNLVVADAASGNSFSGRLVRSLYLGPIVHLTIDADGFQLQVDAPSERAGGYGVGDDITVQVDPKNARLIAEDAP